MIDSEYEWNQIKINLFKSVRELAMSMSIRVSQYARSSFTPFNFPSALVRICLNFAFNLGKKILNKVQ